MNVIREPDKAVITQRGRPRLKPGDEVLRYDLNSDAGWNLCATGAWHKVNSEEVLDKGSLCGFGDKSMSYIAVTIKRREGTVD